MRDERLTESGITPPPVAPPAGDCVDGAIVDRAALVGGPGAGWHTPTAVGTTALPFVIAVAIGTIARVGD